MSNTLSETHAAVCRVGCLDGVLTLKLFPAPSMLRDCRSAYSRNLKVAGCLLALPLGRRVA